MTQETYNQLNDKEKIIYDELTAFSRKLADQMTALTMLMERLLEVATTDP